MLVSVLGLLSLLLSPAAAVFADEAWNTDYHLALLGLPQEDTTFFHQPNPTSKASLIYTLSEQGVLGAVNPRDGSLVWRQSLRSDHGAPGNASFLRSGEGQDLVISGIDNHVAAWAAAEGRLVWNLNVPGRLVDLEILELTDGSETLGAKDAIVFTRGDSALVQRIEGATGSVKWSYTVEGSDTPYQISASTTEVFAIFLHRTILGYIKIKVVTLDSVTGRKKDEHTLSSESELASPDTIIAVGANSASPIIAWTDAAYSVLKVNIIGTKTVSSFDLDKRGEEAIEKIRLHAPYHSTSLAHFLVQYEGAASHWADVFHINLHKNTVEKAYQLPKAPGKGAFSTSTSDANVYFTRVTSEEIVTVSSASHGIIGKWPIKSLSNINKDLQDSEPISVVSEVSVKGDAVSALRAAVLLGSGEWVLLRDGILVWNRLEALATTSTAVFALPHEVQSFAEALEIETHSNPLAAYLHRIQRHVVDLQQLPEVLRLLPQRIAAGFLGTTADSGLIKDTFGFHQVVACAVSNGRVVALDAGDPSIVLWNKQVFKATVAEEWKPAFKASADGVLVVVPGEGLEEIYLNATTGLPAMKTPAMEDPIPARGAISFSLKADGLEAVKADKPKGGLLWRFEAPSGSKVVSLIPRPVNDPVASIGKVLGDRRVLYKYLSPNLALLATSNEATKSASFFVLDTASGATLFSSIHNDVDLSAPISSIMSENWFAYSYTSDAFPDSPKGHQLVVGEMFESLAPNDRGPLGTKSNFSSLDAQAEPFVMTKSYQIPEAISKLSVTQTRQGITSRQLLAVLKDSSSIVGIPYNVLDPRRPANRDPTKDEQAEGLVRYIPVIEFDPKWFLNHRREVIGIVDVITSPALIESTSLVFVYGLDVFGTRLSPSFSFDILGKDFNKFQMLATVAALAVTTFVVAPLVARKQVNARWQLT